MKVPGDSSRMYQSGVVEARRQVLYELLSGASGLILAVFMWGHVVLVGSILTGARGFDWLASTLEEYYIAQPTIVVIFLMFLLHAATAARKIPAKLRERKQILQLSQKLHRSTRGMLRADEFGAPAPEHVESLLWIWQVRTGMIILVLGSFHLILLGLDVLTPVFGEMRGIESATTLARVSGGLWLPYAILLLCVEFHASVGLPYAILLLCVEFHASVGLYRLAVKWGAGRFLTRSSLRIIERIVFWVVLGLGFATLLVLAGVLSPPLSFLLPELPL